MTAYKHRKKIHQAIIIILIVTIKYQTAKPNPSSVTFIQFFDNPRILDIILVVQIAIQIIHLKRDFFTLYLFIFKYLIH